MVAYLPYFLSTKISEREDAHCYTYRNYRAGLLFRRARLGYSRLRRNISICKRLYQTIYILHCFQVFCNSLVIDISIRLNSINLGRAITGKGHKFFIADFCDCATDWYIKCKQGQYFS